jgi:hypothetical protein
MSTEEEKAKEAVALIERAMELLSGRNLDIAWYLLSMSKLALLEVAGPIDEEHRNHLKMFLSSDWDDAPAHAKKH